MSGTRRFGTTEGSLGQALTSQKNSLNLIRLVLATTVILSHSVTLGGYGSEYILHWTTFGTLAVYCFFGISGYLIAASAEKNRSGRFLWHRVLRIMPAYWVCIIITGLVFGYIGWRHVSAPCGLWCYANGTGGPVGYVTNNWWLQVKQLSIIGVPPVPNGFALNGSLWTLSYEFLCYLLVGALAVIGLLRRPLVIAGVALGAWALEFVITAVPSLNSQFTAFNNVQAEKLLAFIPVFLIGSVLYLHRYRLPDSGWLAFACVGGMFVGYLIPVGGQLPFLELTRADLVAPLLVYPMLWLGAHLPGPWIGARNDYSYGVYIFAFPVAELLAVWGVYKWGYVPYTALTIALTVPMAFASWWIIEKRALRFKDAAQRSGRTAQTGGEQPLATTSGQLQPDGPAGPRDRPGGVDVAPEPVLPVSETPAPPSVSPPQV